MDIRSPIVGTSASPRAFDCFTQRETMKGSRTRDISPVDLGIDGHKTYWPRIYNVMPRSPQEVKRSDDNDRAS